MTLRVLNTLSGEREEFEPADPTTFCCTTAG